jgi:hypothetical protein
MGKLFLPPLLSNLRFTFFWSKHVCSLGLALTRCEKTLKEGEPKAIVSQVWERMAGLSLQEYLLTVTPWTEVIEPEFLNVYGTQETIPKNQFRHPM